ncbi:hypothetical protein A5844_001774 [Enterococcus sp. 10A9_DIV0425]|uniref:Thioredoxin domain-containing protein n=1 Tax=Candidatus Enterococcus wittei TaxID=1987383 RepID=A0A242JXN4_9ENTE|nr:thioredoxin family protein [Enterococcus sp. 10A9_DIV0425]OTP10076.1 hypothetical protein A5844_001774 [Enterococcus sp. 10A9_DIV0425]THE13910.1 thioredoxin [Enterococcus hirae]
MKKTTDLSEVQMAIQNMETVVVAISMPNCSVCHAVLPQLADLLIHYSFPAYHLDAYETPEVSGAFQVFTSPVILVFHHGKEIARHARFIRFEQLKKNFDQLTDADESRSYESLFSE